MTGMPAALVASAIRTVETVSLPDPLLRLAIAALIGLRRRPGEPSPDLDRRFARQMREAPIATHTEAANAQHYELPPEFFRLVLGPHLKYSCCSFRSAETTLADAEESALATTAERANLADGQRILELGCGWGSLTLWMAERLPHAKITAVSNSHAQRQHIEATVAAQGLGNVTVVTADMNSFTPRGRFDRVVSVEMFEHMSNWARLLSRVRDALDADGRLFVHVFAHRTLAYKFDHEDKTDWIAQHFFTGGIMPSDGLMRQFPDILAVEQEWRWSGRDYALTARRWLENFYLHDAEVKDILQRVYGADARLWHQRWRLFFLATEGLFGHSGGAEWGVKHYLLKPMG